MILLYKSIKPLTPFFEQNEVMTAQEWCNRLNLSKDKFCSMEGYYFTKHSRDITIRRDSDANAKAYMSIVRYGSGLTKAEMNELEIIILPAIAEINKRNFNGQDDSSK